MLDTPQPLDDCAAELGAPVEQFFSPQTYRRAQQPEQHFAIDNGAFGNFDAPLFLRLVERERPRRDLCRFLTVPDVVGDARRTLEVFAVWRRKAELAGWPLALVVQNGQEHLPIPWAHCDAIFVGGDTKWKEGGGCCRLHQSREGAGEVGSRRACQYAGTVRALREDARGLNRRHGPRPLLAHARKDIRKCHRSTPRAG